MLLGCILAKTSYAESDVQNALLILYNSKTEFQERYIRYGNLSP